MNKPPFNPSQSFSPAPDASGSSSSAPSTKPAFDPTKQFDPVDGGVDFGGVVKDALNEAMMGNGSKMRALMTDPVTQAKVLPYIAQTAGTIAPIPMGGTMGNVGGRQLSNLALKAYGHPEEIPSTGRQVLEGVGAALGDVTAIPAIKKSVYGGQIGDLESAAGVPAPDEIKSLPRPAGTQSVSNTIDDTINSVKGAGEGSLPTYWKQIKDQVEWLYNRGKDEALSSLDRAKLAWLSKTVQDGLNASVPGRAAVSEDMADSLAAPRMIGQAWKAMPPRVRAGLQFFAPTVGLGGLYDAFKTIGGGK